VEPGFSYDRTCLELVEALGFFSILVLAPGFLMEDVVLREANQVILSQPGRSMWTLKSFSVSMRSVCVIGLNRDISRLCSQEERAVKFSSRGRSLRHQTERVHEREYDSPYLLS
jgi:hypothetical protein